MDFRRTVSSMISELCEPSPWMAADEHVTQTLAALHAAADDAIARAIVAQRIVLQDRAEQDEAGATPNLEISQHLATDVVRAIESILREVAALRGKLMQQASAAASAIDAAHEQRDKLQRELHAAQSLLSAAQRALGGD